MTRVHRVARGSRPDIAHRRRVARLRARGWTLSEIARHIGVTKQAVHCLLQKLRRGMAICCHCHTKFDAPEGVATMRGVFCLSCLDTLPDIPFGRRIASLRIIVGFTQEELADRAGISAATLVLLEASKHKPHQRTRDRLLAVLLPALAKVRRVWSR